MTILIMKRAALFALFIISAFTSGNLEGQSVLVSLSFSTNILDVGTPAVVDLLIDCQVESCAAADIRVGFDPEALRVDSIVLGEFPSRTGNDVSLLEHQVEDDGAAFTLRYVTLDKGHPASTGTGVLAQLTITALTGGLTELRFSRAYIAPLDGKAVFSAQTQVGSVLVRPVQIYRTLSVRTEASRPDQVSVSAPDAGDTIVSQTVVGDTMLIEVNSGADAAGELRIGAPGHLACTTAGNRDQEITLHAGDVNDDGNIDLLDAATVGSSISGNQPDEADLNGDGAVDILDLIHIGRNYGLHSGEC